MEAWIDRAGREAHGPGKDLLFCHAALRDAHGTLVADAWENVAFAAADGAALVGANPYSTDGGIASILVETAPGTPGVLPAGAVYALSVVRGERGARVLGASAGVAGGVPPFALRYTADGAEPGPDSPAYEGPVTAGRVRAALVVDGRVVVRLDEGTERFRVRGSAPPETRDPFRAH
jgi:hypothetical protein